MQKVHVWSSMQYMVTHRKLNMKSWFKCCMINLVVAGVKDK